MYMYIYAGIQRAGTQKKILFFSSYICICLHTYKCICIYMQVSNALVLKTSEFFFFYNIYVYMYIHINMYMYIYAGIERAGAQDLQPGFSVVEVHTHTCI